MRNRKRNRVIDFIVAVLSTVRSRKIPCLIQQKSLAIRSLDTSVKRAKRCLALSFAKPSENGKLLLRRVRLKKGVPCGLAILMNWLKLRIHNVSKHIARKTSQKDSMRIPREILKAVERTRRYITMWQNTAS